MRFTYNGRQEMKSTGTRNKALARKIEAKLLTDIVEGRWFEKPVGARKTLRDLLDKYLKEHSARNKALSSHIRDKSLAKHLICYFGDYMLTDISPRYLSNYKSGRRGDGAAPNTVNNELRLLSHAYNLALREWEWVDSNPVSMVSKEKVKNQVERWLTHEEEEGLMSVSPIWLQEILVVALNTGLRQAEILDLTWDRVDLSRRTITILEQKNDGKDTLPINTQALDVLKARSKVRSIKNNLVFYSREGTGINARNLLRAFYKARERAGVKNFRFHDLRHTFATRLVQAGVDLYKVQKLLRHKTPIMTQRYAHHYPESLRDGVEVLDNINTILVQSKKKGLQQTP
ncbi:MAG: tyrosine-type recombinase/integrase [Thermodesulfobacteriota bacterium]